MRKMWQNVEIDPKRTFTQSEIRFEVASHFWCLLASIFEDCYEGPAPTSPAVGWRDDTMFSDSRVSVSKFLETLVERPLRSVVTALMAGCALLIIHGSARSLTGAEDVGPDDIGSKASVALYYKGAQRCGGVVFQDRYILTVAHCFTDGNGHIDTRPQQLTVLYWSSGKAKRDARMVAKLVIHENYLFQEGETARLGNKAWNFDNFPVNHEDIAVLKLKDAHPVGAISASVSDVDNEYTGDSGHDTWFYMYGSSVNGVIGKLQKALIGQYGPLERVIPSKKPEIFYTVRQMTTIPSENGFDKNVSQCKGDSGSGVFLVKSDDLGYEEHPDKLPNGIQLRQGLPIVVGLVSNNPITDASQEDARCGRDIKAVGFRATRVDYYHDWILSKIKEMQ